MNNKKLENITSKDLKNVTGGAGWWQQSASKLWDAAAGASTAPSGAWNWAKWSKGSGQ
jgi:hypothetical protein